MNSDQILGIVRHLLTTLGGMAIANGFLNSNQVTDAVGAIMALVGIGWSIRQKTHERQLTKAITTVNTAVATGDARVAVAASGESGIVKTFA